jgi:chromosome segregation ATPase
MSVASLLVAEMKDTIDYMTRTYASAGREIERLEKTIAERATSDAHPLTDRDQKELKKALADKSKECDDKNAVVDELSKKLADKSKECDDKNAVVDELSKKLAAKSKEFEDKNAEMAQLEKSLREPIDEKTSEVEKLKKSYEDFLRNQDTDLEDQEEPEPKKPRLESPKTESPKGMRCGKCKKIGTGHNARTCTAS